MLLGGSIALSLSLLLRGPGDPEPSLDERRMAVMPEGMGLEEPPIRAPDGREWKQVHSVAWSSDGSTVAYVGVKGGMLYPVIGETIHGSYHYVSGPTLSRAGDLVAFRVGMRTGKETESWWLQLNGETMEKEDWIGEVAVSADGLHVAFWKQPGAKVTAEGPYSRGKQVLVVGTRRGDKWHFEESGKWEDASSLEPPLFSADGAVVASRVSKGSSWFVLTLVGKKETVIPKGGLTFLHDHALSPDGKRIAFSTGDGPITVPGAERRGRVVVGKEAFGAGYDDVGLPAFSLDSAHVVFKFLKGGRMGLAVDDERIPEGSCTFVHKPVFSPDGKQMAFVTNDGGEVEPGFRLVPTGEYSLEGGVDSLRTRRLGAASTTLVATHVQIRDPVFSEDGRLLAYRASDETGWRIRAGDAQTEAFDEVGPPRFSKDGKHVAFGARSGRELWWRVLQLQ
jgi:hypothetical protein